jgi:hypothetical protein
MECYFYRVRQRTVTLDRWRAPYRAAIGASSVCSDARLLSRALARELCSEPSITRLLPPLELKTDDEHIELFNAGGCYAEINDDFSSTIQPPPYRPVVQLLIYITNFGKLIK